MRMMWAKRRNTPQPAADRLHFVMQDFLKMFAAAVVGGLAFSLLAAGVTLLLVGEANAAAPEATLAKTMNNVGLGADGEPGQLAIGDGADATRLAALERDWQVRVSGRIATIRVMQSWALPEGEERTAVFSAELPEGAALRDLRLHTPRSTQDAFPISSAQFVAVDRCLAQTPSAGNRFSLCLQAGALHTAMLPDVRGGDVITVEYHYTLPIAAANGRAMLTLDLPATPATRPIDESKAALWVEWASDSTPNRLLVSGADVEIDAASTGTSLGWEDPHFRQSRQVTLTWDARHPTSAMTVAAK